MGDVESIDYSTGDNSIYVEKITEQRLTDELLRNSLYALIALILASLWVGIAMTFWIPVFNIVLWLGILDGVCLFRFFRIRRILRKTAEERRSKGVIVAFTVGAILTALIWSISLFFFIQYGGEQFLTFYTVVSSGIMAAAIASLSYRPKIYLVFTGLLAIPISVFYLVRAQVTDVFLGVAFLIYWAFVISIALRYIKSLKHSWKLDLENQVLAEVLSRKNDDVQSKNDELKLEVEQRLDVEKELRHVIEELKHANEAKSSFLATVSHEIRTPMNGLLGMFDLLSDTPLSDSQKNYLKTATGSAESLLRLLDDLLDFSKSGRGELSLEHIPFQPRPLVEEICLLAKTRASRKGIEMRLIWDETDEETLVGDPTRFRQIISNLLGNAVKFTDGGSIRLEMLRKERNGSKVCYHFEIEDSGIGIDEEALEHIFQPFTQADSSMNRRYGGTGLGLAISKQLIEMMGGTIECHSKVEQGTLFRFSVCLELADGVAAETPVSSLEEDWKSLRFKGRVLVVEDDLVNQKVIGRMLDMKGLDVQIANDGRQGIESIKSERWDLVLMDCQMPVLDGLSATRAIREWENREGCEPAKIVALTANASDADREACMAAGMNDFLSKPIRSKSLTESLSRWFVPEINE